MAKGDALLSVDVLFQGFDELKRAFLGMPEVLQKKIMRGPLRVGEKLIQQEAMRRAPVDTGLMRDSMIVRALKRSRVRYGYKLMYRTLPTVPSDVHGVGLAKVTKAGKRHFYPAVIEYGATKGNHPPMPFLRPAFDAKKDEVVALVGGAVREVIAEFIKQAAVPGP